MDSCRDVVSVTNDGRKDSRTGAVTETETVFYTVILMCQGRLVLELKYDSVHMPHVQHSIT